MTISLLTNTGLAFLVSFYYGIDIALALTLLLLLVFIINSKKKQVTKVLPLAVFILLMNAFYLIPHYSSTLLIEILRNDLSIIIFGLSLIFEKRESKSEISSLLPLVSLALLPRLFALSNLLELAFTYLSTLLLFQQEKSPFKRYSFLLFLFLNFYYIEALSLETIFLIITPLLVTAIFSSVKLMLVIFLLLNLLPSIIKEPTIFFQRPAFLAPLVAVLTFFILKDYFKKPTSDQDEDVALKSQLRKVQDYLELLEKEQNDPSLTTRNLEENLRIKPCQTCYKKDNCSAVSTLINNLPNKIYKPYKTDILKKCPNGGKLVYRYQVVKDMVENEMRLNSKHEEEQRLVSGLLSPIKTLCSPTKEGVGPLSLNNLLGEEVIKEFTATTLTTYRFLKESEIQLMQEELDAIIDPSYRYIIYSNLYLYRLKNNKRYGYKVSYFTRSYQEGGGGDLFYELKSDKEDELYLLDAMGHQEETSSYARFGLSFLVESKNIFSSLKERLKEANLVLKYHSKGENYLTLDLLRLDKKTGESSLIKLGSAPSFLLEEDHIERIDNTKPPLGILSEFDYEETKVKLNLHNKLLITTDGFEHLEEYLPLVDPAKRLDLKTLTEGYLSKYPQMDDLSIALISLYLID